MPQHQGGCPLELAEAAISGDQPDLRRQLLGAPQGRADIINDICPDRRCSTWLDLRTWFGWEKSSLSQEDFSRCFTGAAILL